MSRKPASVVRKKYGPYPRREWDKACQRCGGSYVTTHRDQMFCSRTCAKRAEHPDEATRFMAKVPALSADECWPWMGRLTTHGYGAFKLQGGRETRAHRWMLEHTLGYPLGPLFACHRCDNPRCVNPAHLFPGTNADNAGDMKAKGRARSARGEDHPHTKLTADQVAIIRANPVGRQIHARNFGVARATIDAVVWRRSWRHVP